MDQEKSNCLTIEKDDLVNVNDTDPTDLDSRHFLFYLYWRATCVCVCVLWSRLSEPSVT